MGKLPTYVLCIGDYGRIILFPLEELVTSDPLQVSTTQEQHTCSSKQALMLNVLTAKCG